MEIPPKLKISGLISQLINKDNIHYDFRFMIFDLRFRLTIEI